MSLTHLAFYIFLAVATGGVGMAGLMLGERQIPAFLGPAHGAGGLIGVLTLLAANLHNPAAPERAWWALGVFSTGLLVGIVFFRLLYKGATPAVLVALHASIALIGLAMLYGAAFP